MWGMPINIEGERRLFASLGEYQKQFIEKGAEYTEGT